MATNPLGEDAFYQKMSNIDQYIKPVLGPSESKPVSKKDPTVYDAIKAGLLVPTQNFVQKLGSVILHQKDEKGHTAAHWACLGGHVQVLRYLIDQGAPFNEAADAEPHPLPIHWACTNGHIAIVDVLLQQGVSIDSVDGKGCTPLIVAAQYGKTMLAGYLMGKGAKLQITDRDGDNALHWAGFKGHDELLRLLIYSGFTVRQRDEYGQTVLHLACINGNLNAVRALCEQDDIELDLKDKNGKTPYMLAAGRKHEDVTTYLKKKVDRSKSLLGKVDVKSLIFGPPGKSKYPILFFLVSILFYGYPMYLLKCLYNTWDELWIEHILFWISNLAVWVSLYHANSVDPGFLPRNIPEYDMAIKQVAHFSEWKEGDVNPLSKLCHTCRTIKPKRSKHCRVCNRCVDHFDHHCPWIYNCVGYRNRLWFFRFVGFISCNAAIAAHFFYRLYLEDGFSLLVIFSIPLLIFGLLMTEGLFLYTIYQMLINRTTNEGINWRRYTYLQDANGKFKNPYDRGPVTNVLEYFHYLPPQQIERLDSVTIT